MTALIGDIGGTNARLALVEEEGTAGGRRPIARKTYATSGRDGLTEVIDLFLREVSVRPDRACFALAGPVEGDRCHLPNAGWTIEGAELRRRLGGIPVRLVNDFDAVGHAVLELGPDDLATLQEGERAESGPIAVLGAGTGLGHSFLVHEEGRYRVQSSEGGHVDFAATTELDWGLYRHLRREHGHVSVERVVSGPGLAAVHEFLRATGRGEEPPEVTERIRSAADPAAEVARAAREDRSARARRARSVFLRHFGARAGDLALTVQASGGVYVAGGIAPRMLDAVREGPFLEAFRAKGRFRSMLERVPVHVVVRPDVGLLGAAVALPPPSP